MESIAFAKKFLNSRKPEVSYYWFDEGLNLELKCRPDFRIDDYETVIDIKTSRDVSHDKFRRSAFDLDYDLSAALTLRGIEAVTGVRPEKYVFLAVESGSFPDVALYEASSEMIEIGEDKLQKAVRMLKDCESRAHWPVNYGGDVLELSLPPWLKRSA